MRTVLWVCLLGSVIILPVYADLRFEWKDRFSKPERVKLTAWINETSAALEDLVGPFEFDVRIVFHRARGAREPVPWANTQRSWSQGVHFHVNPAHSLEAFRRDWTAPHELSHLVLPYVGSKHAWFAEGFASYMQYQVMHAMGTLSASDLKQRYARKFARAERGYEYPTRPFTDAAPRLRARGRYSVMYWGGSVYFMNVDQQLKTRQNGGLLRVLRAYLACCRRSRGGVDRVATDLDQVAGTSAFTDELRVYRTEVGFPRRH